MSIGYDVIQCLFSNIGRFLVPGLYCRMPLFFRRNRLLHGAVFSTLLYVVLVMQFHKDGSFMVIPLSNLFVFFVFLEACGEVPNQCITCMESFK